MKQQISPAVAAVIVVIVVILIGAVGYFTVMKPKAGGGDDAVPMVDAQTGEEQMMATEGTRDDLGTGSTAIDAGGAEGEMTQENFQ